jgi:threonine dehydrogenase-like Zn-dependent dehydrogenase
MMRQATITGERQSQVIDIPGPQPKDDWVLVKVHVAPMCTEYKGFVAGRQGEYLGHEAAGEVVAIAQPGQVNVGDRVVVMPQTPCGKCALCLAGEYIHYQAQDAPQLAAGMNARGLEGMVRWGHESRQAHAPRSL